MVAGIAFLGLMGMTISGISKEDARWDKADGKVLLIKRECTFNVVETDGISGKKKHSVEQDSCNATDEFADMRGDEDRSRNIAGKAKISVEYKAVNGSTELAAFELTGRDDAFYTIRKGDKVSLKVSKAEPQTVRLN